MRVTISFAFELENDDPQETENPIRETGEKTGEKIVKAIFQNPNITIAELAEAVNISVNGVEWQIRQLKKKNIIRRVGADKGGYWQIITESEDKKEL